MGAEAKNSDTRREQVDDELGLTRIDIDRQRKHEEIEDAYFKAKKVGSDKYAIYIKKNGEFQYVKPV